MTVRRRLLLSAGFFSAAVLLAGTGSVRAQFPGPGPTSPGRHARLPGALTSDQVKRALQPYALPPGISPEVVDTLRDKLQTEQGINPKLADAAVQKLLTDPAFRKQLEEAARRQKATGKPPFEEIERLRKNLPEFMKNPPGWPPKTGELPFQPPFGPGFPPKTGDPKVEPMPPGGPEPPDGPQHPATPVPTPPQPMKNGDPPMRPGEMPGPERPEQPPAEPVAPSPFDPSETPRERTMRTFASMWERNIGPLDETPAVKRALFDLVAGTEDFKDAQGNSIFEGLAKETGDATSFADFIDNSAIGESWSMSKFELPSFNWSRSNPDIGRDRGDSQSSSGESWWNRRGSSARSSGSSGGGGGGFGLPGLGGSWLSVILLAVILLGALVLWRFWYLKDSRAATAYDLSGLGPWPVDPHRIATRRDVVLAFEYLSVLICGPVAKTWTHNTIAAALADLATTHGETAVMLARLYELARYTPVDEPLTTAELAEARRLVCRLAGLESE